MANNPSYNTGRKVVSSSGSQTAPVRPSTRELEENISSRALDMTEGYGDGLDPILARKLARDELEPVDYRVPDKVRNACWAAAEQKYGKARGKRGVNPLVQKEYEARIVEYKERKSREKEDKMNLLREKLALEAEARAKKLTAKIESKREVKALKDEVTMTDLVEAVDSWEDLDKEPYSSYMHPDHLVESCKIEKKEEKEVFQLPHNHEVLAESRKIGDTKLRLAMLRRALNMKSAHPNSKPAVVDVGAGATGVKAAINLIRDYQEADRVFHHAMFPFCTAADLARDNTLASYQHMINWISPGVVPRLDRVNVCSHLARDCVCLSNYDSCFVFAVHSHYYFDTQDWKRLFTHTDCVEVFGHTPEVVGLPVPRERPEFVWRRPPDSENLSFGQKLGMQARKWLFGPQEDIVFEPLGTHGTTYVHRDPRVDMESGGFHIFNSWAEKCYDWAQVPWKAGAMIISAGLGASAVVAMGHSFLKSPLRLSSIAKQALAVAMVYPATAAMTHAALRNASAPAPGAVYSVQLINGQSVNYMNEEVAHFYKFLRTPVTNLERRRLRTYKPDVSMAKELASTMLLSKKDPAATLNVCAARCLRKDMHPERMKDTIAEAQQIVKEIGPKNEIVLSSTPRPPDISGRRYAWVERRISLRAFGFVFTLMLAFAYSRRILESTDGLIAAAQRISRIIKLLFKTQTIRLIRIWNTAIKELHSLGSLSQMDRLLGRAWPMPSTH